MKIRHFLIIIIGVAVIANTFVYSQAEEKSAELVECNNPAGCVGKFPKGTDWPVCPICNTPISSVVDVSKNGNITEEIVSLLEKIRSFHDEIEEIKEEKRLEEQERIKNLKAYDVAYARKVRTNLQVLADAYARTKVFLEKGGKEVPDSVIVDFIGGQPVWKRVKDFQIYPKPK